MLRKEVIGYAAFDKESGKGLACSYGMTYRLSLTEDPDKVVILDDQESIKIHTVWFNNSHKNQKEFEIKKVKIVTEIQEDN